MKISQRCCSSCLRGQELLKGQLETESPQNTKFVFKVIFLSCQTWCSLPSGQKHTLSTHTRFSVRVYVWVGFGGGRGWGLWSESATGSGHLWTCCVYTSSNASVPVIHFDTAEGMRENEREGIREGRCVYVCVCFSMHLILLRLHYTHKHTHTPTVSLKMESVQWAVCHPQYYPKAKNIVIIIFRHTHTRPYLSQSPPVEATDAWLMSCLPPQITTTAKKQFDSRRTIYAPHCAHSLELQMTFSGAGFVECVHLGADDVHHGGSGHDLCHEGGD